MDHDAAVKLDERVRRMADATAGNLDALCDLLTRAKAGEIHEALGFDSWAAYLADALAPISKTLDADDRRALVMQLYEVGMSVRDISAATGVPRSTVGDQVSETGHVESTVIIGHDGKTYQRNRNGGHRGQLTPVATLNRARSSIENIPNLAGDDADLRTQICELIDRLCESLATPASST